MKYVVAVSGGVDSVVMLDMLVKLNSPELIVAHFDHGIRPDSSADARFVAGLAATYGLPFELGEGKLGEDASEEQARDARYGFLREVARRTGAMIATAHHRGDVIETIAINLTRGTGWRGLAVLNDPTIYRPMLGYSKHELYEYASIHRLEWVEDETNATDAYMRNRIRHRVSSLDDISQRKVIELWLAQRQLAQSIDHEVDGLLTRSRYFMTMISEACASEILRGTLAQKSLALTRPQRLRVIHAIKTGAPGSTIQAGAGVDVSLTRGEFIVKHP